MPRPILTDRRALLIAGAATSTMLAVPPGKAATPASAALPITPQPLPFAAGTVGWLSERLLTSHHDNNYAGAVKRLAAIRAQWATLDMASAATFAINGLKREELIAWNSMILHELYFAGLSGTAAAPSAALAQAIERDFGSRDRWQGEFAAMGRALGGGSGWVLLTWSPREGRLVNQWAADHTMALAGATPLLALDMYEHAYAMDFGAKAAAYVDLFIQHLDFTHASKVFAGLA